VGAESFRDYFSGSTAQEAFDNAVKEAQHYHGHGGYTGTIAEKDSFQMATSKILSNEEANHLADELENTTFSDKWGPAGCIQINSSQNSFNKTFMFFGWASS